jgi:hypothetical protein
MRQPRVPFIFVTRMEISLIFMRTLCARENTIAVIPSYSAMR